MATNNETAVDRLWSRLKNNKYLALLIVGASVTTSIVSFSDGFLTSWRAVDALIPDKQQTALEKSGSLEASQSVFPFSSTYEVADNAESNQLTLSKDNLVVDFGLGNRPGNFVYTLQKKGHQLVISPYNSYLLDLKKGRPVTPVNYRWTPFAFQFPALDFQVINHSSATVFFKKAVFNVSRSVPDSFPLILLNEGYNMQLPIQNLGWGTAHNCQLLFKLLPPEAPPSYGQGYQYQYVIGDFKAGSISLDLRPYFQKLGVKLDVLDKGYAYSSYQRGEEFYTIIDESGHEKKLSSQAYENRLREARGSFRDGVARIVGELQFEGLTAAGKKVPEKVRFSGLVYFSDAVAGAPASPHFAYTVQLEANQTDYQKEVSLSQVIRPQEAAHFNLKLFAPQSSRHFFTLTLIYDDNKQFTAPNIALNYLMTRADSSFVREEQLLAETASQLPEQ
ncbi:hypothetical protein P1X16_26380 [Hymenobacter sp. YC55]|nr:hypothetical protein [Hymenobacter sp. YC55]